MNYKHKISQFTLATLIAFSSLGISKVYQANATGLNYNALSSQDKKVFDSLGIDKSKVSDITSTIEVKVSGGNDISKYQWTAWYNRHTKNFTIDKSDTDGNYNNGFPKSTSSAATGTNFTRVGYYKYLRDPVYKKLTLTATQTFKYKYKVENKFTDDVFTKFKTYNGAPGSNVYDEGKSNIFAIWSQDYELSKYSGLSDLEFSERVLNNMTKKYYDKNGEELPNGNHNGYIYKTGTYSGTLSYKDYKNKINISISPADFNDEGIAQGRIHYIVSVDWVLTETKKTIEYVDKTSQPIEIARTSISNVSATELAKYNNFKLDWKGGSTNAKSTTINKSNGGWWGRYSPSYHKSSPKTEDSNGGSRYYAFSTNGSYGHSINLYNMISKKEKLFTEHAVDLTVPQNPDYKYTVKIDPNGGKYKESSNIQSVSGKVNTSTQISRPIRENYTFLGWQYSGEGTWSAASGTYTFTGDGVLKAKWLKIKEWDKDDPDNSKPDDGPGPKDKEGPGTPPGPSNPLPDDKKPSTKYILRIDPNGGKYNYKTGITTITANIGTYCTVGMPTRKGYIFDGWKVISGNSNYFTQSKYYMNSTYVFYGNATIQAKWVKVSQTTGELIIDPNGGTYENSTIPVKISKPSGATIAVRTPIRDGYLFIGWDIDTNNDINGIFNTSSNSFLFKRGQSVLKARWKAYNPPSCIMDGTGPNACPDSENETINKFVHLTKNPR